MPALREEVVNRTYERAVRSGKVPRKSYAHYFLEDEGIHSRLHLQNFYSTFWPDVQDPATATVRAFGADGEPLGQVTMEVPRFGSLFLEAEDLLQRMGAQAKEGLLAADLEPPAAVRDRFADLPAPDQVNINTPFWMAYRDASDNYMYVHSIDTIGGETHGTTAPLRWHLNRAAVQREAWRSWRLLDVELLEELQVVAVNHGAEPGTTIVGVHDAAGPTVWSETVELGPRQLKRVRVPAEVIAGFARDGVQQVRIGLDPLLTANGKPYVIMRYGGGPLSLHHG